MPSVYLVGFMASGKSTVAARLAAELSMPCFDLDDLVEQRARRPIAEIFAEHGEDRFRALESEILAELCGKEDSVVALGGGAFCNEHNRRLIQDSGGVSVYLAVPWGEISRRLAVDHLERPLFVNLAQTAALFAEREPIYRLADMTVHLSGGEGPAEVASQVAAQVVREAQCAT